MQLRDMSRFDIVSGVRSEPVSAIDAPSPQAGIRQQTDRNMGISGRSKNTDVSVFNKDGRDAVSNRKSQGSSGYERMRNVSNEFAERLLSGHAAASGHRPATAPLSFVFTDYLFTDSFALFGPDDARHYWQAPYTINRFDRRHRDLIRNLRRAALSRPCRTTNPQTVRICRQG